jgi:hypothetical protein
MSLGIQLMVKHGNTLIELGQNLKKMLGTLNLDLQLMVSIHLVT